VKILFLTPQVPYPPRKGTALRNWGLISGLAKDHELALLSFVETGQREPLEKALSDISRVSTVQVPLRKTSSRVFDMLRSKLPDMALRLASQEFSRELTEWLDRERFDVVQVEGIEMAPYIPVIQAVQPGALIVFDDHNCEYLLQQRAYAADRLVPTRWLAAAYSLVQYRRLKKYEAQVCQAAHRVLAVSDQDAAALRSLVSGLRVTVVPNGVDVSFYGPHKDVPRAEGRPETLVFTGTMDFRPNIDAVLWFHQRVLPIIRERFPSVRFYIVGQRPHRRLDRLRDDPAVAITGSVSDVRPFIAEADVYVAPLRVGGGTRLKLLEALSMGKAVVSTRVGAEGYPVQEGRHLMLADSPLEFAEAVVALLHSPNRRASLGKAAREFVVRGYDWRLVVPKVECAYAGEMPSAG
jgi:sugar transferase (PEP-CTERM/EpsH1 system associated)